MGIKGSTPVASTNISFIINYLQTNFNFVQCSYNPPLEEAGPSLPPFQQGLVDAPNVVEGGMGKVDPYCFSCSSRSVPRRSARPLISTKNTGTRIRTWIVEVIMPPTIGAAIGFITSEPMPDSHRIGTRLARTAQTVMSFGRKRWTAPSMAASSTSAFVNVLPDCSL